MNLDQAQQAAIVDPEQNNNSEVDVDEDAEGENDDCEGSIAEELIELVNEENKLEPGVGWIKRSYWLLGRALRATDSLDVQSALTQPK